MLRKYSSKHMRSTGLFVLSFALLLPSFTHVAQAVQSSDVPQFVKSFGETNPSSYNGKFDSPRDIAVDSNGNVFVTDNYNRRVQKFSNDGTYIAQWGSAGFGDGQFQSPTGIAVDADNNVYVTDTNNSTIQKFSNDGTFISSFGGYGQEEGNFSYPADVSVNRAGDIFVVDEDMNNIQKFSSDGTFISSWGVQGEGDGEFLYPHSIATDTDDNVYVADTNNNRIQKFDSDGTFMDEWGGAGDTDGLFYGPSNLAVDGEGYVYVTDSNNSRVQKFDSEGNFVAKWGSEGSIYGDIDNLTSVTMTTANLDGTEGKFRWPEGIAADSDGNIFIVDSGNHRIQKFSSDGTFMTKWGSKGRVGRPGNGDGQLYSPSSIAVDQSGNVYVTDTFNSRIQKFSSDGTFMTKWGTQGNGDGEFFEPYALTIDKNGNVFVADSGNHRIQKFSSNGTFIAKWGSASDDGPQMDSLGLRRDKMSANVSTRSTDDAPANEFNYPVGITVDKVGNVYVADSGNSRIQKFTNNGTFITKWGSHGRLNDDDSGAQSSDSVGANSADEMDGMFYFPVGIAVDPNGNVYVADNGNDRIQKFTSDGTFLAKWGSYGAAGGDSVPYAAQSDNVGMLDGSDGLFNGPNGISIDQNGNIYVADSGNNRIQKFTNNGTFLAKWGSFGSANDGESVPAFLTSADASDVKFKYPIGVAADKNGNIYVADTDNNRIQKFTYPSQPPKTATVTDPKTKTKIVLSTPAATTITKSAPVSEQSLEVQDDTKVYPFGLVDFELEVPAGSTQQINLTFLTHLKPSDVVARKYHATDKTYTDVPGAVITETTVEGKPALQLTYSVTDGGSLDDDKTVNGVIVDPVGLAVANDFVMPPAPGAPDTGIGSAADWSSLAIIAVLPIIAGVAAGVWIVVRRRA